MIQFNEGSSYLELDGIGLPSTSYFLLSSNPSLGASSTLAGGMSEISGTGYARISQATPSPSSETISFSAMTWSTVGATNWPNDVAYLVLATTSNASGHAVCAWPLSTVSSINPPTISPNGGAASGGSGAAGVYYWQLTSVASAGETNGGNEYAAYVVANGKATLSWSSVAGASGYNLYRSASSGGEGTSPALVKAGVTSPYTDLLGPCSAGSCPATNGTTSVSYVDMSNSGTTLTLTPDIATQVS